MNINDEYESSINCTDIKNEDKNITINNSLLSFPANIIILLLIGLLIYTMIEHLLNNKYRRNFCIQIIHLGVPKQDQA